MKPADELDELVGVAVRVHRQLVGTEDWRANKLSREAFLAAGLKLAGITEQEAQELRARLEQDPAAGPALAAIGQEVALWTALERPTGSPEVAPAHAPGRVGLDVPARIALQAAGVSEQQAIGIAALSATESNPAAFGTAQRDGEGYARADALRAELVELHRQIEAAVTLAHLELEQHPAERERRAGWVRLTVKGTPITAGPELGRRLVEWAVAHGLDGLPAAA